VSTRPALAPPGEYDDHTRVGVGHGNGDERPHCCCIALTRELFPCLVRPPNFVDNNDSKHCNKENLLEY